MTTILALIGAREYHEIRSVCKRNKHKFQRCLAVAASLESKRRKRRKVRAKGHHLRIVDQMCVCSVASVVSDSATLQTVALQAPPCMAFSRRNTGVGSPGDLPGPGIKCLLSPALAGGFFTTSTTWKAYRSDSKMLSSGGNGEGNGTPLQYSCLENPMDGGAW